MNRPLHSFTAANRMEIYTDTGRPDSVKRAVEIIFTVTPARTRYMTHAFEPMIFEAMGFSGDREAGEESDWFEADFSLGFTTYTIESKNTISIDKAGIQPVSPGHLVILNPRKGDRTVRWSSPVRHNGQVISHPSSILAINKTGTAQNVVLCAKVTHNFPSKRSTMFESIVAYGSIENDRQVIVPSELELQAYELPTKGAWGSIILQPENLTRPLLANPLNVSELPPVSRWRLSQDSSNRFQLTRDNQMEARSRSSASNIDLAKSMAEMRGELDIVLKSLNDREERLAAVERSVVRALDGVASGHHAMEALQKQLSAMEVPISSKGAENAQVSDHTANNPTLEAKTESLAKSVGQTLDYLSGVQRFLHTTRQQLSNLDLKVPALEAKTESLATSLDQTKEDVCVVEKLLANMDGRLSIVEAKTDAGSLGPIMEATSSEKGSPITFPSHLRGDERSSGVELPELPTLDFPYGPSKSE